MNNNHYPDHSPTTMRTSVARNIANDVPSSLFSVDSHLYMTGVDGWKEQVHMSYSIEFCFQRNSDFVRSISLEGTDFVATRKV